MMFVPVESPNPSFLYFIQNPNNAFGRSTTEWRSNLTLPAISICSTNYVNYTALKMQLSEREDTATLLADFNEFMRVVAQFNRRGNVLNYIPWKVSKHITNLW